jgi:hypothetical protein
MRLLSYLLPMSRREAEHSAERISQVMSDLSWAEIVQATVLVGLVMILMPTLLLALAARDAWA